MPEGSLDLKLANLSADRRVETLQVRGDAAEGNIRTVKPRRRRGPRMTTVVIELPYNVKAGQAVERLNGGLRQDRTFSPTLGLTLGLGCPDLPRHQTCPQTTHRDAHVAINLSDEA